MSSVERTGFSGFCYNNRWHIAQSLVLPSTICISLSADYLFEKQWLMDSHSDYPAAAFVITLNTIIYIACNVLTQNLWFNYWKNKNEEATKESLEEAAVQASSRKYNEAHRNLEKALHEIKKVELQIETSTKGLSGAVQVAEKDLGSCKSHVSSTLKVRDDFITQHLSPAVENLATAENSLWFDLESKIKDSKIRLNLGKIFSILKGLIQTIHESKTDNEKTKFSIPAIIKDLNQHLRNIKQILFELEENNKILTKDMAKDQSDLDQYKTKDLRIAEKALEANLSIKYSEAENHLYLDTELSVISSRLESLKREKMQIALESAKEDFEKANQAFQQNVKEQELILTGSSNMSSSNTAEATSIALKTLVELVKLLSDIKKDVEAANQTTLSTKKELDTTAGLLREALKKERDLISRKLMSWQEEFYTKRAEVEQNKKKAIADNNQSKSGLLSFGGSDDPHAKLAQQRKIETYFDDLLGILDTFKLLYEKTKYGTDHNSKPTFPVEIPNWDGKGDHDRNAIQNFSSQISSLKKCDLLLPYIIQLFDHLNKSPINYEDHALIRLYINLSNPSLRFGLSDNALSLVILFKKQHNSYLISKQKQEDLKYEQQTVEAEHEKRKAKKSALERNQSNLSDTKELKKLQFETKYQLYLKNTSESKSLKELEKEILAKKNKLTEATSTIDQTISENRTTLEQIRDKIEKTDAKIKSSRNQIQANTTNLDTLKPLKDAIEKIAYTTQPKYPSLLDQFHSKDEEFQQALAKRKTAEDALATNRKAFDDGTKKFEEEEKNATTARDASKLALEEAEKNLVKAKRELQKAEHDSVRLNAYLQVRDKCDSAIKFYEWKRDHPEDTTEKTSDLSLAFQKCTIQMIRAKTELALKKQGLNLERARLGDLKDPLIDKDKPEDSENAAIKYHHADEAKYNLSVYQLDRHRVDQEWRTVPELNGPSSRTKCIKILQNEEIALVQFFRLKKQLLSAKERRPDVHEERCTVQATLAFIDLFARKLQLDLIRCKAKRVSTPKSDSSAKSAGGSSPEVQAALQASPKQELKVNSISGASPEAQVTLQASPKQELKVNSISGASPEAPVSIITKLKKCMQNTNFKSLIITSNSKENFIVWLTEALELDERGPRNKSGQPKLGHFYGALKRIVKTINIDASSLGLKLSVIEAKLELLRHLATKPTQTDKVFNNDFEKYKDAKITYRKIKYAKKIEIERLEKEYITHKKQYVTHNNDQIEAKRFSFQKLKDTILEYPLTEKISYLAPTLILFLMHKAEIMHNFPTYNVHLSPESGMAIWKIMTIAYLCFQIAFPRENPVNKKSA